MSAARALTVTDRETGEVIDVRAAEDEQLARFCDNLEQLRGQLTDAEGLVHDEMLARLDRLGKWTHRVGDPKGEVQFEVKAPSPTAGTTDYDVDALERKLGALVMAGEVEPEAAARALRKRLVVTMEVPWGASVDALRDKAEADPRTVSCEPSQSVQTAGVKALERMGGAAAQAVEVSKVKRAPGKRRVKVKPIRREG